MSNVYNIQYLQNHEIDRNLWDACIDQAENGLIYATSIYLDSLATNWNAIIINDYNAVLPLPWNRKFGFSYVYTPPFIQQLGLFYDKPLNKNIFSEIKKVIERQFKFGEYYCNFLDLNSFSITSKTNFILELNKEYKELYKGYKQTVKYDLKKALQYNLQFLKSGNYPIAIQLYKLHYSSRTPHIKTKDYENLLNLFTTLANKKQLLVREVVDNKEQLLAITVCLKYHTRIYLLLSLTTLEGREKAANHFMVDQLIQEFAGQELTLDFEGSDIPGIAHFFKSFGARNEPYYFYRWNNLPWPINCLKDLSLNT